MARKSSHYSKDEKIFIKFANYSIFYIRYTILGDMKADINRLKVVLAEKKRTGKWLAKELGKDPATISKWCTNVTQPGLETLIKISYLLNVEVGELVNTKDKLD